MSHEDFDDYDDYDDHDDVRAARGVQPHRQGKHMFETPLMHKIVAAVAAACVVGGGTVVLNSREKIAVLEYASVAQDARLVRIETKLDVLIDRPVNK